MFVRATASVAQSLPRLIRPSKLPRVPAIEAHPVDTAAPKSSSNLFMGTAAVFEHDGFGTVAERFPIDPLTKKPENVAELPLESQAGGNGQARTPDHSLRCPGTPLLLSAHQSR